MGDPIVSRLRVVLCRRIEILGMFNYGLKTDIPAYFVTVIITPKGNPKNIKKIEDFAGAGVCIDRLPVLPEKVLTGLKANK
jgi:molybdate transport system substrate-binding protein